MFLYGTAYMYMDIVILTTGIMVLQLPDVQLQS